MSNSPSTDNQNKQRQEKSVFLRALDLPTRARNEYVETQCRDDAELLTAVRSLMAGSLQLGDFLEPPQVTITLGDPQSVKRCYLNEGVTLADRYRVRALIGEGASGVVYEVDDLLGKKVVAAKVFAAAAFSEQSPIKFARVRREVATLRHLRIPGVVQLFDDGVEDGLAYLIMERVDGQPFPSGTAKRSWEDLEATVLALLETLKAMHHAGVVHCDLKPSNVLVDKKGRPTVLDVGISAGPALEHAQGGVDGIAGTPGYMSPKRLDGENAEPADDLYALGVMLTNALVWEGAPQLPESVATLLRALTAKEAKERITSAREALELLGKDRIEDNPVLLRLRGTAQLELFELQDLFAGPERIHQIPSTAAKEVWTRTAGKGPAVADLLTTWLRSGIAQEEGEKYRVSSKELERLRFESKISSGRRSQPPEYQECDVEQKESWHLHVAEGKKAGDGGRLLHLLQADEPALVCEEASLLARRSLDEGKIGEAIAFVDEALSAFRRAGAPETSSKGLLLLACECARGMSTAGALDHLLYEVKRSFSATPMVENYERIALASLRTVMGDGRSALDLLDCIESFEDFGSEVLRLSTMEFAARRIGNLETQASIARSMEVLAQSSGESHARAIACGMRAWILYMQGRFSSAGSEHEKAAALFSAPDRVLTSLLSAASSYLDAAEFDASERLARKGLVVARGLRHAYQVAQAEYVLRSVVYRSGIDSLEPDLELISAVGSMATPWILGRAYLTEAAIA